MANIINLGQTISVSVTFYSWDDTNDSGNAADPDLVEGFIKDAEGVVLSTFTPIRVSTGVYLYEWTPSGEDDFYLEFRGTFNLDTTPIVDSIEEFFTVTAAGITAEISPTLGEDQYIYFMSQLTPIYVDPEEILAICPDASPIEVNEFLYTYSAEVNEYIDESEASTLAYEYVKAATLCALSKVYSFSNDEIALMTLGDFTIQSRPAMRGNVTRGTATTWCALSEALRTEFLKKHNRAGIKLANKGSAIDSLIPIREIEEKEEN